MTEKLDTRTLVKELSMSLTAIRMGIEILIDRRDVAALDKELIALKALVEDAYATTGSLVTATIDPAPVIEMPSASGGTSARRITKIQRLNLVYTG